MMVAKDSVPPSSVVEKLRAVRVGVREDLDITRHVFRGEPAYVVRDPITFQTHRLEAGDYEILISIDPSRSLAEIFDNLVEQGKTTRQEEEAFYQFIVTLHTLGFLRLPISDHKLLYRRHLLKKRARRREKMLGFLFLRIPVWNPNAFLDRTMDYVRPVFSRTFFMFWLALVLSALFVAVRRWDQLVEPLQGLLATHNLALMWITLIVLKFFHELGHAYACKHYGGYVPEMGIFMIVFTPCAYMDATASWGFPRKMHRILVCLGGMYVETTIAAIAVFVWAATSSSIMNAVAYNVIFLASTITILFNINPLLRYDGYYMFSDLVEIPNLRKRATDCVCGILKRVFLSVRSKASGDSYRLRALLCTYGVSASIYRVVILLAIAGILAIKMSVVGLLLAILFLGSVCGGILIRLLRYLWRGEETAPVRFRAISLGVVIVVLIPVLLVLAPVPSSVVTSGVLKARNETVVRARRGGFLQECRIEQGQQVHRGTTLAQLLDDTVAEETAIARANLKGATIRRDAYRVDQPVRALQEQALIDRYESDLRQARGNETDLDVTATTSGRVVECISEKDLGRFLPKGTAVATIVSGEWQIRSVLTENEIAAAQPCVGDLVEFRPSSDPATTMRGTITRIAPAGSRIIELVKLTHAAGGSIAVDSTSGEAIQPHFEVVIELSGPSGGAMRHGMTGAVRLSASAEPLGAGICRTFLRFVNRLLQN